MKYGIIVCIYLGVILSDCIFAEVLNAVCLMQYRLYQSRPSEYASRLILFFNGWAMTPESVEHLAIPQGFDLMVVWDYRLLDLPSQVLQSYEQIYLIGWSMGVWAIDRLAEVWGAYPIAEAIAVCGTGYPMHDRYGIPIAVFEAMLSGVSEANRERFNRRMCGGRAYRHLLDALAQRSTREIRSELLGVYECEQVYADVVALERPALSWSRALVGERDRVIPSANQLAYWGQRGVQVKLYPQGEHYLLAQFDTWEELWA